MIYNSDTASHVAASLLQIKAIKLNSHNPFTWASGLRSPIYCDNRITLSYPRIRTYIRQGLTDAILRFYGETDVIAGVATAGIPQGVMIAQELGLPFVYVRPASKLHGLNNQIEGVIEDGQSVVVIEDLVSTGKSSLNAVKALRKAGAEVRGMAAIFTYDLPIASKNFKEARCKLVTLSDYNILIKEAEINNFISENDKLSLMEWREDPQSWSNNHQIT